MSLFLLRATVSIKLRKINGLQSSSEQPGYAGIYLHTPEALSQSDFSAAALSFQTGTPIFTGSQNPDYSSSSRKHVTQLKPTVHLSHYILMHDDNILLTELTVFLHSLFPILVMTDFFDMQSPIFFENRCVFRTLQIFAIFRRPRPSSASTHTLSSNNTIFRQIIRLLYSATSNEFAAYFEAHAFSWHTPNAVARRFFQALPTIVFYRSQNSCLFYLQVLCVVLDTNCFCVKQPHHFLFWKEILSEATAQKLAAMILKYFSTILWHHSLSQLN